MMDLPEEDKAFLDGEGFKWRLLPDGENQAFLIIKDFSLGESFDPLTTDLMIRIPALYNTTPLDMWYCFPAVRLGGQYPNAADQFETHAEISWQRFSRHLQPGSWKPGIDGLRSFFTLIRKEMVQQ